MPGKLRAIGGVARPRHAVGDVAHLGGRATQTVDQQHAHPIAADEVAVVLLNRHTRLVLPLASRLDTRAIAYAAPLPTTSQRRALSRERAWKHLHCHRGGRLHVAGRRNALALRKPRTAACASAARRTV